MAQESFCHFATSSTTNMNSSSLNNFQALQGIDRLRGSEGHLRNANSCKTIITPMVLHSRDVLIINLRHIQDPAFQFGEKKLDATFKEKTYLI